LAAVAVPMYARFIFDARSQLAVETIQEIVNNCDLGSANGTKCFVEIVDKTLNPYFRFSHEGNASVTATIIMEGLHASKDSRITRRKTDCGNIHWTCSEELKEFAELPPGISLEWAKCKQCHAV
jgi:hypothetical protein